MSGNWSPAEKIKNGDIHVHETELGGSRHLVDLNFNIYYYSNKKETLSTLKLSLRSLEWTKSQGSYFHLLNLGYL